MTGEGQSALERLWEELAGISRQIASLAEQVTQLQKGVRLGDYPERRNPVQTLVPHLKNHLAL